MKEYRSSCYLSTVLCQKIHPLNWISCFVFLLTIPVCNCGIQNNSHDLHLPTAQPTRNTTNLKTITENTNTRHSNEEDLLYVTLQGEYHSILDDSIFASDNDSAMSGEISTSPEQDRESNDTHTAYSWTDFSVNNEEQSELNDTVCDNNEYAYIEEPYEEQSTFYYTMNAPEAIQVTEEPMDVEYIECAGQMPVQTLQASGNEDTWMGNDSANYDFIFSEDALPAVSTCNFTYQNTYSEEQPEVYAVEQALEEEAYVQDIEDGTIYRIIDGIPSKDPQTSYTTPIEATPSTFNESELTEDTEGGWEAIPSSNTDEVTVVWLPRSHSTNYQVINKNNALGEYTLTPFASSADAHTYKKYKTRATRNTRTLKFPQPKAVSRPPVRVIMPRPPLQRPIAHPYKLKPPTSVRFAPAKTQNTPRPLTESPFRPCTSTKRVSILRKSTISTLPPVEALPVSFAASTAASEIRTLLESLKPNLISYYTEKNLELNKTGQPRATTDISENQASNNLLSTTSAIQTAVEKIVKKGEFLLVAVPTQLSNFIFFNMFAKETETLALLLLLPDEFVPPESLYTILQLCGEPCVTEAGKRAFQYNRYEIFLSRLFKIAEVTKINVFALANDLKDTRSAEYGLECEATVLKRLAALPKKDEWWCCWLFCRQISGYSICDLFLDKLSDKRPSAPSAPTTPVKKVTILPSTSNSTRVLLGRFAARKAQIAPPQPTPSILESFSWHIASNQDAWPYTVSEAPILKTEWLSCSLNDIPKPLWLFIVSEILEEFKKRFYQQVSKELISDSQERHGQLITNLLTKNHSEPLKSSIVAHMNTITKFYHSDITKLTYIFSVFTPTEFISDTLARITQILSIRSVSSTTTLASADYNNSLHKTYGLLYHILLACFVRVSPQTLKQLILEYSAHNITFYINFYNNLTSLRLKSISPEHSAVLFEILLEKEKRNILIRTDILENRLVYQIEKLSIKHCVYDALLLLQHLESPEVLYQCYSVSSKKPVLNVGVPLLYLLEHRRVSVAVCLVYLQFLFNGACAQCTAQNYGEEAVVTSHGRTCAEKPSKYLYAPYRQAVFVEMAQNENFAQWLNAKALPMSSEGVLKSATGLLKKGSAACIREMTATVEDSAALNLQNSEDVEKALEEVGSLIVFRLWVAQITYLSEYAALSVRNIASSKRIAPYDRSISYERQLVFVAALATTVHVQRYIGNFSKRSGVGKALTTLLASIDVGVNPKAPKNCVVVFSGDAHKKVLASSSVPVRVSSGPGIAESSKEESNARRSARISKTKSCSTSTSLEFIASQIKKNEAPSELELREAITIFSELIKKLRR